MTNTYTTKEVAELFGYSETGWREKVRNGTAPVKPIPGTTTKYRKAEVDNFLDPRMGEQESAEYWAAKANWDRAYAEDDRLAAEATQ